MLLFYISKYFGETMLLEKWVKYIKQNSGLSCARYNRAAVFSRYYPKSFKSKIQGPKLIAFAQLPKLFCFTLTEKN